MDSSMVFRLFCLVSAIAVICFYIYAIQYTIKNKKWVFLYVTEIVVTVIALGAYLFFFNNGEGYEYFIFVWLSFLAMVISSVLFLISVIIGLIIRFRK